jgi:hypothetical protein
MDYAGTVADGDRSDGVVIRKSDGIPELRSTGIRGRSYR